MFLQCYCEHNDEVKTAKDHKGFRFDEFCKGCGKIIEKYGNYRACSKICLVATIRKNQRLEAAPKKCLNCKTMVKTKKKYMHCSNMRKREYRARVMAGKEKT